MKNTAPATLNHAIRKQKMVKVRRLHDGATRLFPDTREGCRQARAWLQGVIASEPIPKAWQGITKNHGLVDRDLRK